MWCFCGNRQKGMMPMLGGSEGISLRPPDLCGAPCSTRRCCRCCGNTNARNTVQQRNVFQLSIDRWYSHGSTKTLHQESSIGSHGNQQKQRDLKDITSIPPVIGCNLFMDNPIFPLNCTAAAPTAIYPHVIASAWRGEEERRSPSAPPPLKLQLLYVRYSAESSRSRSS